MKNYSRTYRLLHWSIAIVFVLLLLTIFLRATWLNKHNVAAIIQNYLSDTKQTLTEDQILILAKKIRQPMWAWHIYFGYVLTGLFSIRFILPFFGKMKFQNPFVAGLTSKEKMQKWTYIIFYLCVITSLATGLLMKFGPESLQEIAENIHVLGIYYLIGYILIHLGGVLIAEFTDQKGIISKIVSGSNQKLN